MLNAKKKMKWIRTDGKMQRNEDADADDDARST